MVSCAIVVSGERLTQIYSDSMIVPNLSGVGS
jgi:hypothetical protein